MEEHAIVILRVFNVYVQQVLQDHDVNGVGNGSRLSAWDNVLLFLVSVCSVNTCQNGGTCRQTGPTMAECICQTGFTGPTCSLRKFSSSID